jgi:hypothetical protein
VDPIGTIAHEATHTIQDWRNAVTTHNYAEADAFVAGTVAAISTGKQYFLEYSVLEKAGRLVIAGKGVAGNAEWQAAYEAVVAAIEADPQYARKAHLAFTPGDAEKGTDEAKVLGQLLEEIKQAEAFGEWAYDAAKSGYRGVVDGVTSVLP